MTKTAFISGNLPRASRLYQRDMAQFGRAGSCGYEEPRWPVTHLDTDTGSDSPMSAYRQYRYPSPSGWPISVFGDGSTCFSLYGAGRNGQFSAKAWVFTRLSLAKYGEPVRNGASTMHPEASAEQKEQGIRVWRRFSSLAQLQRLCWPRPAVCKMMQNARLPGPLRGPLCRTRLAAQLPVAQLSGRPQARCATTQVSATKTTIEHAGPPAILQTLVQAMARAGVFLCAPWGQASVLEEGTPECLTRSLSPTGAKLPAV